MTIRDMHYDFKQKLNSNDSQQYQNFRVPEIDWKLNEAMEVFIKTIAQPRGRSLLGFEATQRIKDDLKTLVKKQFFESGQCLVATKIDDYSYKVTLPTNYMFYSSSRAIAIKNTDCQAELVVHGPQDDDLHQESPFDKPSFEWRETNGLFYDGGFLVKSDGSFSISHVCMNYIRKPLYMHNAQDFDGGTYDSADGSITYTGFQNCELPEHTHREIVDLAVLLTTGHLTNDLSTKQFITKVSE